MDYHICLISSDERPQEALTFKEIALLLLHSFSSLKKACTLKLNQINSEKINILLNYHNINHTEKLLQKIKYIPYQLEQFGTKGWQDSAEIQSILRGAVEIWDYSQANIDFLRGKNLPAKYLPIGYHPALEIIPPAQKDIDVLFYGSINERRAKILEELKAKGLKVEIPRFVFGKKRDEYITRAKIVLNIHYYETKIFEAARISHLLNNKSFVITEQSVDNPYTKIDLVSVPYEQLVDTCLQYLADYSAAQKIAELNYQQFKENYPMTEFLKKVI